MDSFRIHVATLSRRFLLSLLLYIVSTTLVLPFVWLAVVSCGSIPICSRPALLFLASGWLDVIDIQSLELLSPGKQPQRRPSPCLHAVYTGTRG